MGVKYKTHAANVGRQPNFKDGQIAGMLGESIAIEAVEIELDDYTDNDVT